MVFMKHTKILFIDTSQATQTTVALLFEGKRFEVISPMPQHKDQVLLPSIERVLTEHAVGLIDLDAIHVVTGPGSFTGLRVGIAIVNMLGTLLMIPINSQPVGVLATAEYQESAF